MKRACGLLLLLVVMLNSYAQSLTRVKSFGNNPGHLKMYMYSPPGLSKDTIAPVVVVLHGCMQTAKAAARISGWNKLADTYKFNVIYPEQRLINNPGRCFCWYRNNDIEKGKGENYSIEQMVEHTKANYAVDSTQVFVTGLSAGAAMSVALMANYPKTFNAGAIFAGGAYKMATNFFSSLFAMEGWIRKKPDKWGDLVRAQNPGYPGPYPRMIIYQGNADVVVHKHNGVELMKQWTNLHNISTTTSETIKGYTGSRAIEKNIYRDASNKDVVLYYKIKHMGHALLVDPGKSETQGGKHGLFTADKNYFSTYWTAVDFGLIHPNYITGPNTVTPQQHAVTFYAPAHKIGDYKWSYPKDCKLVESKANKLTLDWGSKSGNVDVEETRPGKGTTHYATLHVIVGNAQ